jgi:hypothetical protein
MNKVSRLKQGHLRNELAAVASSGLALPNRARDQFHLSPPCCREWLLHGNLGGHTIRWSPTSKTPAV